MPKEPKSIKVRLPQFESSKAGWRRGIHKAVYEAVSSKGIRYSSHDHLEVRIRLYFDSTKIRFVDVDNRAKDILDAFKD